jgi:hypothetical protein
MESNAIIQINPIREINNWDKQTNLHIDDVVNYTGFSKVI